MAVFVSIEARLVRGDGDHLADCDEIPLAQDAPVHFLKIFVDVRAVGKVRCSQIGAILGHIRKLRDLGDVVDYIHTEAVDSFIRPELHDAVHLFPHKRIIPVQIRLFFCIQVQKILITLRFLFPSRKSEVTAPVVRRQTARFPIPKEVIIPVGAVFVL